MRLLRRVLYLQAAVWAIAGIGLAIVPRSLVTSLFGGPAYPDYAWVRIAGLESFGLALLMVLMAHRAADVWWWSWAFVITSGAVAVVAAIQALVGLPAGSSSILWWVLAAVNAAFFGSLLWGLGKTGQERPLP